jgi:hypothetical protein
MADIPTASMTVPRITYEQRWVTPQVINNAIRYKFTLGKIPERVVCVPVYLAGVLEIDKEAYVIESGNYMKPDSVKFLPLKRKHKARYLE